MFKLHAPTGYPNCLYIAEDPENPKFFLAKSLEAAQKNSKFPVSYVFVADILRDYGHQQTHNFFKSFADTWICREGYVFFPEKK